MSFKLCSRFVFKSFRKFEKFGDRILGSAGPYFVLLAAILILGCAITFFEVVFPNRFLKEEDDIITGLLGLTWCNYIVYSFCFHYFKAITTRSGSPIDLLKPSTIPTTNRSWKDLLPQALCIGPLNQLSVSTKLESKSITRRSKEIESILAAQKKHFKSTVVKEVTTVKQDDNLDGSTSKARAGRSSRVCKKCPAGEDGLQPFKPERTHHCSVCKRCILKFDHHCPWLNQCVGLNNERYFLLFLCYFSVGCACVAVWGLEPLLATLDFSKDWPYYTPRSFTLILWALTTILGLAVGVMAIYQIFLIMKGETSVEASDNDWYRKQAKAGGKDFRNVYDLGRLANLAEFFNIGPDRYHWSTIFLPISIPSRSSGMEFRKAVGWKEFELDFHDELTDEELASDDE